MPQPLHPSRRPFALVTVLLAAFGAACGSSDSSSTGTFVDSAVQGLRYEGPSFSGVTDSAGRYRFEEGDEVCFSIGDIPLGCSPGTGVVTPIDLFEGAVWDDDAVINVVRLLLSLDADGDPGNGIDLRGIETSADQADDFDFEQDPTSFGMDAAVLALVAAQGHDGTLEDPTDAASHFAASLDDNDVFASRLLGRWTYARFDLGIREVSTVDITGQLLEEIQAESDEESLTFVTDGEGPDTICEHYAYEIEALRLLGYLVCYDPSQQPAGLVPEEEFYYFRLDKIVSGTDYATSDLLGDWLFIDDVQEVPMFGVPLVGDEIFLDQAAIDEVGAEVSPSGVVRFTTIEEPDVPQGLQVEETCSYRGQMSVAKDWIAGAVTCSISGEKSWAMERAEAVVVVPE